MKIFPVPVLGVIGVILCCCCWCVHGQAQGRGRGSNHLETSTKAPGHKDGKYFSERKAYASQRRIDANSKQPNTPTHDDYDSKLNEEDSLRRDKYNHTQAEVADWLKNSEEQLLRPHSNTTASSSFDESEGEHYVPEGEESDHDAVEEFLIVLHSSAEVSCAIASQLPEKMLTIYGEIVTLHVAYWSSEDVRRQQQRRRRVEVAAGGPYRTSTRLSVELGGDALSQFCSKKDKDSEGKSTIACQPLCLVTVHFTCDMLSDQLDDWECSPKNEMWDSFLVIADDESIVDPDMQPPFRKPIGLTFSVKNLAPSQKVQCMRWNYSFWDPSTCTQSQRLSPTMVECRCSQLGYFKLEYNGAGVNKSTCPFLKFRVLNVSKEDADLEALALTIKDQIIRQINVSEEPCSFIATVQLKHDLNESLWVRLKFGPDCEDDDWKYTAGLLDELIQHQNFSLFDKGGNRLSIPRQKVQVIHTEEEGMENSRIDNLGRVAAAVFLTFIVLALLIAGVLAIRKYRRKRKNSVRVVRVGGFVSSPMTPISTIRISSTQSQSHSAASGHSGVAAKRPKTNVRRMGFGDFDTDGGSGPDQNHNSFVLGEAGSGRSRRAVPVSLPLPNSTVQ